MDYKNYNVEDFILDEKFRKWVLDPDRELHNFWTEWLEAHPQKAATVKQAIELLRQISVQYDGLDEHQAAAISHAIEDGIDAWEQSSQKSSSQPVKTVPLNAYTVAQQKINTSKAHTKQGISSWLVKIAASVIFIIGMLYAFMDNTHKDVPQAEQVYKEVIKDNPSGQKLTVFLADGSKVMLNAGSKIRYSEPFHPDRREVSLVGEAYFEVAKDSLRPFQVVSGELATTALGTSFNIAAYPTEDCIQVSLTSGKVKVDFYERIGHDSSEVFFLLPGEQIGFNRQKQSLTKRAFDREKVLAWKEGIIYLENEDQATVVRMLERWYGTQVKVEGKSAADWSVTARFDNQSLKSVLTSLSYTMGFEFKIREDHVLIKYPNNP